MISFALATSSAVKAEQVQKAVEAALKKAGINPTHVDSEDHMESNMAKGWITSPFLFQTAVAKLFGTQSKAFECQDLQFRISFLH